MNFSVTLCGTPETHKVRWSYCGKTHATSAGKTKPPIAGSSVTGPRLATSGESTEGGKVKDLHPIKNLDLNFHYKFSFLKLLIITTVPWSYSYSLEFVQLKEICCHYLTFCKTLEGALLYTVNGCNDLNMRWTKSSLVGTKMGVWMLVFVFFFVLLPPFPKALVLQNLCDFSEWLGLLAFHCWGCHANEILGKNFLSACWYADPTETVSKVRKVDDKEQGICVI